MASTNPITTNTHNHTHLTAAYSSTTPAESRAVYEAWAASYDEDMRSEAFDYLSPQICAQKVAQYSSQGNEGRIGEGLRILDAGCGTGLVGMRLRELGVNAGMVDGCDLSGAMLAVARKSGVYRELSEVDLSVPMQGWKDGTYDVLVCTGTLTHGHVGPKPALEEFVRVTRRGGLLVATVLGDIWASGEYKSEVERLRSEGKVEVLEDGLADYRRGAKVKAVVLVLRVK